MTTSRPTPPVAPKTVSLGGEPVAQDDEQRAQLLALVGVEGGEQLVLGLLLRARGAVERSLAGGRERHQMTAAVGGVALTGDQTVGFQRVEQRHEDARVDVERLHQLALRQATVVVQQPEDLELPRLEVVRGVRRAQPAHRLVPEQRQEQAGPRAVVVEDARHGFRSLPYPIVNTAIRL